MSAAADVNPGNTNGNQSENSRTDTLRNAADRTYFSVVVHDTEESQFVSPLETLIGSVGKHMLSFCSFLLTRYINVAASNWFPRAATLPPSLISLSASENIIEMMKYEDDAAELKNRDVVLVEV